MTRYHFLVKRKLRPVLCGHENAAPTEGIAELNEAVWPFTCHVDDRYRGKMHALEMATFMKAYSFLSVPISTRRIHSGGQVRPSPSTGYLLATSYFSDTYRDYHRGSVLLW
jgi:hypothetical protein